MQAIITKYHKPTKRLSARISATSAMGDRVFIKCGDMISRDIDHRRALKKLCRRKAWYGVWTPGMLKDGSTVWVHSRIDIVPIPETV